MADLDSIRSRRTQRGTTCSLCGLYWPCDATQLADELTELRETVSLPDTDPSAIRAEMRVRLPAQLGGAVGVTKFRDGTEREWAVYVPGPVHPDRLDTPAFNGWLVYCIPQWLTPAEDVPQDLNIGTQPDERSPLLASSPQETERRRAPGGCEDEETA